MRTFDIFINKNIRTSSLFNAPFLAFGYFWSTFLFLFKLTHPLRGHREGTN